jgi:hypothetical protein
MVRAARTSDGAGLAEAFEGLRSDYDAAKQTRFKRKRTGIVPTGSGADYHYRSEAAYFGMVETARDLCRNHCLVGMGFRHEEFSFGQFPFRFKIKKFFAA